MFSRYVLIACDGLWKAFDNRTATEFINKVLDVSGHSGFGWLMTTVHLKYIREFRTVNCTSENGS